jgi:hypothetical protein
MAWRGNKFTVENVLLKTKNLYIKIALPIMTKALIKNGYTIGG